MLGIDGASEATTFKARAIWILYDRKTDGMRAYGITMDFRDRNSDRGNFVYNARRPA
jgi:hypothetical protein